MRKCVRDPDSWWSQALLIDHQDPGPSTCHDDKRPFEYAFMQPTSITLHDGRRCHVRRRKWYCHCLPPQCFIQGCRKQHAWPAILPNLTLYEGLHDTSCLRVCLRSSNGMRMNGDESRAKEPSSARRCLNLNQHHVQHALLCQVLPVVQA